ncbi:MAG: hypothetical protein E5299_01373 [Burkholderia gladioli]|nr:MAG: hypothetical protein E5299_01373 [Burkholderia gladioli]
MSSAVMVPTTPSHAMRPLLHAVLFLRVRHARVPFIGQRICPVRRGVMARLMQLPVTVVENGSKTVATTADRIAENAIYRFKTLTGNCLWARHIAAQATEVSIRVGVINRMADLARPQSVRMA